MLSAPVARKNHFLVNLSRLILSVFIEWIHPCKLSLGICLKAVIKKIHGKPKQMHRILSHNITIVCERETNWQLCMIELHLRMLLAKS